MLDMIGVGPFITLPLLLSAMGGPQAMLGWICGALLALCDGLVWAELGAMMPEAGGTYRFLRTIYPGQFGRFLAFLFVFQLMISAPLSVASGSIGLAQYAPVFNQASLTHTPSAAIAIAAILLAIILLYRNLASLRIISYVLWLTVIATIAWILITAAIFGHISLAFDFPSGAFHLGRPFFAGLASAMLITTYDFWGYYNITFLGAEVRSPARTIPRAILISIAAVLVLYLAMNTAVLTVVPWRPLLNLHDLAPRQALISYFIQSAYTPSLGASTALLLGKIAAVLIMITAFASIFSLLLGYSRIPYAAARDGNFFAAFGKLHPRGFPYVSLLYLGGAAILFSFLSLAQVIAALVVLRIVVQFLMQHIGVMILRRTQPALPRPFRIWLYPLPPLLALAGFTFILLGRANYQRQLALAAVVVILGALAYALRGRLTRT
jgi:amino acid transporter